MPHAIARVAQIRVGFIDAETNAGCRKEVEDLGAAHFDQGANKAGDRGANAPEATQAGAPDQRQQHCLRLVVKVMASRDGGVAAARGRLTQECIPSLTRGNLQRDTVACGSLTRVGNPKVTGKPKTHREVAHQGGIPCGGVRSADTVVKVGDRKGDGKLGRQLMQGS